VLALIAVSRRRHAHIPPGHGPASPDRCATLWCSIGLLWCSRADCSPRVSKCMGRSSPWLSRGTLCTSKQADNRSEQAHTYQHPQALCVGCRTVPRISQPGACRSPRWACVCRWSRNCSCAQTWCAGPQVANATKREAAYWTSEDSGRGNGFPWGRLGSQALQHWGIALPADELGALVPRRDRVDLFLGALILDAGGSVNRENSVHTAGERRAGRWRTTGWTGRGACRATARGHPRQLSRACCFRFRHSPSA